MIPSQVEDMMSLTEFQAPSQSPWITFVTTSITPLMMFRAVSTTILMEFQTNQSIDLVLTVNGVPVVTMELKTDNTQRLEDGLRQYMRTRRPTLDTPLLRPGRCLVHFAVSNQNVQVTTVLDGRNTRFIPFDKGNDGHAGNPPSETGSPTDYLWREVLAP